MVHRKERAGDQSEYEARKEMPVAVYEDVEVKPRAVEESRQTAWRSLLRDCWAFTWLQDYKDVVRVLVDATSEGLAKKTDFLTSLHATC